MVFKRPENGAYMNEKKLHMFILYLCAMKRGSSYFISSLHLKNIEHIIVFLE